MKSPVYINEALGISINLWDLRAVDLLDDGVCYFHIAGGTETLTGCDGYKDIFHAAIASGLFVQSIMGTESLNAALISHITPSTEGQFNFHFRQGNTLSGKVDDFARFSREIEQVRENTGMVMPLPTRKIY